MSERATADAETRLFVHQSSADCGSDTDGSDTEPVKLGPVVALTRELVALVRGGPVARIRVEVGGIRVEVDADRAVDPTRPSATAPAVARALPAEPPPAEPVDGAADVAATDPGVVVRAPLVGVFYRRPAPERSPFVQVGDRVEAGAQVAIVEAMKMLNPIVADRAGTVVAVHVEDGEIVEFDQALVTIEPG